MRPPDGASPFGDPPVSDADSFRLSRIEAEGWNAARKYLTSGKTDDAKIAGLNPHKADPERARWLAGFRNAMDAMETK
jgi:ribosome modulation factor